MTTDRQPQQGVVRPLEYRADGCALLEGRRRDGDQLQPEEDEAEIKDPLADLFPTLPAEKPEHAAEKNDHGGDLGDLPDDELHGDGCAHVGPEDDRQRPVEAHEAGAHHADDEHGGGRAALEKDRRDDACRQAVEGPLDGQPEELADADVAEVELHLLAQAHHPEEKKGDACRKEEDFTNPHHGLQRFPGPLSPQPALTFHCRPSLTSSTFSRSVLLGMPSVWYFCSKAPTLRRTKETFSRALSG